MIFRPTIIVGRAMAEADRRIRFDVYLKHTLARQAGKL